MDTYRSQFRKKFVELAGGKEARILLMPSDTCVHGKYDEETLIDGGETRAQFEERLGSPAEYGRWAKLDVKSFKFVYRDTAPKLFGVAVDEDTALIVQPDWVRVAGEKFAHVFLRSKDHQTGYRTLTWHMLHPGDEAVVRDTADGYRLEMGEEKGR